MSLDHFHAVAKLTDYPQRLITAVSDIESFQKIGLKPFMQPSGKMQGALKEFSVLNSRLRSSN